MFYTVIAHCYGVSLGEGPSATMRCLDNAMHMLQGTSQAVARLATRGLPYCRLAFPLSNLLQEARASLDSIETRKQQQCSAAAELAPLSHEAARAQLQPLNVCVPPKPMAFADTSSIQRKAVANLAPTSRPPDGKDLQQLSAWVQRKQRRRKRMAKQEVVQMLHEIEMCLFWHAGMLACCCRRAVYVRKPFHHRSPRSPLPG